MGGFIFGGTLAIAPDPWQRTDIAERIRLAQQLARLQQRYAGAAGGDPRFVSAPQGEGGPTVLAGQTPGQPFNPVFSPALAAIAGPAAPAAAPGGGGGGGALGPYNLAGDGGAWGPSGINLYNPLHARGDMGAPGPIGRGPGFWTMDNYGTPFWRQDWVPARNDPLGRAWLISGET